MNNLNELNSNNLSLKELNFIAILNTIDKTKLQELIQKSDMKKVFEAAADCECKCGTTIFLHLRCVECAKITCDGFKLYNTILCIECSKGRNFKVKKDTLYVCYRGEKYSMHIGATKLSYKQIKNIIKYK